MSWNSTRLWIPRPSTISFKYTWEVANNLIWQWLSGSGYGSRTQKGPAILIEDFGLTDDMYTKLHAIVDEYKVIHTTIKNSGMMQRQETAAKSKAFYDIIDECDINVDEFRIYGARAMLWYQYSVNMYDNLQDIQDTWTSLTGHKFPESGDLMCILESIDARSVLKLMMNQ